jgi:hypothetical protein
MTEAEWLACDDPKKLLEFVRGKGLLSKRKGGLFAVACCRLIWDRLTDERSRYAVVTAERFADGLATDEERRGAHYESGAAATAAWDTEAGWPWSAKAAEYVVLSSILPEGTAEAARWDIAALAGSAAYHDGAAAYAAWAEANPAAAAALAADPEAARKAAGAGVVAAQNAMDAQEMACQAPLVRDLFGPLPFRPVSIDPAWLTWGEGTVRRLAEVIYEERPFLPYGHLDATRLAVLADALEDAGCNDVDLLNHCRQPRAHFRGCWVIDLLLGKE